MYFYLNAAGIRLDNKGYKQGEMKRKLLGIVAILGFGLALSACSNTPAPVEQGASDGSDAGEPENNGEPATKTGSYTIKVYDIDDEVLGEKTVSIEDYPVFIDGLNANFDAVLGSSSYGSYPISINGSVVDDPNWYMASYENGEYCLTSLEGLVVDDGDLFEFKVTCSNEVGNGYDGTMDSYDVLVDKTIYHYAKTYMKAALESSSSSSRILVSIDIISFKFLSSSSKIVISVLVNL